MDLYFVLESHKKVPNHRQNVDKHIDFVENNLAHIVVAKNDVENENEDEDGE